MTTIERPEAREHSTPRLITPDASSSTLLIPDFENFPRTEAAISNTLRGTVQGASAAAFHVLRFTSGVEQVEDLPTKELNRRVIHIDKSSDAGHKDGWSEATVKLNILDGEGSQEEAKDKLGEAMPTAVGNHGNGDKEMDGVVDEVEATKKSAHGRKGAVSIIGITTKGGLTHLPQQEDGKQLQYVEKMFAPGTYKGIVDIRNTTAENINAIMKEGIPAEHITFAIMKRDCNNTMIRTAKEMGVNLVLIPSGDLEWGMRAMLSDPEYPIVAGGRGGGPEGSVAMVGGRALDALAQIRVIEDPNADVDTVKTGKIWTAEEFITGAREHSMIIFSAVTGNDTFDLRAVRRHEGEAEYALMMPPKDSPFDRVIHPGYHLVHSMIISSNGLQRRMHLVPIVEYRFEEKVS